MNDIVTNAIELAVYAHRGQVRKNTGLPYISHPFDVVRRLTLWGLHHENIRAAGYLHDVLEDCPSVDINDIYRWTNMNVGRIVRELTNTYDDKEVYLETFQHSFISSLLIKIADRLCNVEDFYEFGDKTYAPKYFLKARPVYKAFFARADEILDTYGEPVFMKISGDISGVGERVGVDEACYNRHRTYSV